MTGKKKRTGKDTTDTSRQGEKGTPMKNARHVPIRIATEEDLRKRQHWNVGTFHRASTLLETETSDGEEKETPEVNPPHCPQELVKALRKQGIRVKLTGPLEERLNNELMMEGWHGKRNTKE